MAAIRHLKVVRPANVKRTVALPVRKPNAAYRSREHLSEREVERLVEAASDDLLQRRITAYPFVHATTGPPPQRRVGAGQAGRAVGDHIQRWAAQPCPAPMK